VAQVSFALLPGALLSAFKVIKDKGTIILSMGSAVHVVEHSSLASSTTRIVQTLRAHPDADPVHALSLSHDSTLLAVE